MRAVRRLRARVEHRDVRMRGGSDAIEAVDHVATARRVGIAGRRQHDRQRGAAVPLGLDAIERPGERVIDEDGEVGGQTRHDRLRFRDRRAGS